MNFYEMKGMLLNNQVTAFIAEKVMDLADICKFIITGSWAQEKEDLVVGRILTDIFHKKLSDITYLDIGANKWRHGNNTYFFYKKSSGILEENNLVPDFLSIDIEGMDFQALQTIDYEKYRIKVIVAEQSDERNKDNETMDQFMVGKGYVVHGKTRSNVVYVRKTAKKYKEKL